MPIRKYGITVETMSPMSKPSHNKHTMKAELLFVGRDERRGKLRDARLQREHLAVDAGKRRVQAAVVGIKYGGGFGHDHRTASM